MTTESVGVQKKGVITKCPSCGAAAAAFASVCASCGHEFAEVDANRTIRALVARFDEIERDVEQQGLGMSRRTQAIIEKKSRVIRDFPIPNAREDLQQLIHFIHPKVVDSVKPDPNIEDWRAKFAEVMSRARSAYQNDATALAGFDGLEKSLNSTLSNDLKIKAKRNPLFVILLAGVAVLGIGWIASAQMEKSRLATCEGAYAQQAGAEKERLEKVEASATQDLQAKQFTQAMAAASHIRWETEAAGCKASENVAAKTLWDEKRTQLVKLAQQGIDSEAAAKKAEADQQVALKVAEQKKETELARIAADQQAELLRVAANKQAEAARAAAEQARVLAVKKAVEQRQTATEKVF